MGKYKSDSAHMTEPEMKKKTNLPKMQLRKL
jgi:hypothetical protein